MIDNVLAKFQARRALDEGETVELAERVTEEHFCILEPENVEHFRAVAGKLYEEVRAAQVAFDDAKRALARLKSRMEAAGPEHSELANKLLMSPPQGCFPFTGRLVFLRSYGATIQLDDEGHPIAETWRKATDAERAWVSKQDEARALEAENARQLGLFDESKPNGAEPMEAPPVEEELPAQPYAAESDDIPF